MYLIIVQRLILEALADFLYFPVWWYSFGLIRAGKWAAQLLSQGNQRLAPGLWLKNLFVPMYGQHDLEGRLISFVMRLIQLFFRAIAVLLWFIICMLLWLMWLVVPVIIIYACFNTFLPKLK